MAGRAPRRGDPNGQVVPLMTGVVVLVALCAVGLGHLGAQAIDRARAQNAADAAALAAAVRFDANEAEVVAEQVARRNGATVTELRRVGVVTVVQVRRGDHDAIAAATPVATATAADP